MIKKKIKAATIHLLLSFAFIAPILIYTIIVWYPAPFLEISGLKNILILLLSVDLILGPILTFIIFNSEKKSVKFDLTAIVIIQVSALFYGILTIYNGHPVYITYAFGQFTPLSALEAEPKNARHKQLKVSTLGFPKMVYTKLPDRAGAGSELLNELVTDGGTLESKAQYYEPYEKHKNIVLNNGLNPNKLFRGKQNTRKLEQFLATTLKDNDTAKDYRFVPLNGKIRDVIWALDKITGEPVGFIDVTP